MLLWVSVEFLGGCYCLSIRFMLCFHGTGSGWFSVHYNLFLRYKNVSRLVGCIFPRITRKAWLQGSSHFLVPLLSSSLDKPFVSLRDVTRRRGVCLVPVVTGIPSFLVFLRKKSSLGKIPLSPCLSLRRLTFALLRGRILTLGGAYVW